jgi:hypothetical protein
MGSTYFDLKASFLKGFDPAYLAALFKVHEQSNFVHVNPFERLAHVNDSNGNSV